MSARRDDRGLAEMGTHSPYPAWLEEYRTGWLASEGRIPHETLRGVGAGTVVGGLLGVVVELVPARPFDLPIVIAAAVIGAVIWGAGAWQSAKRCAAHAERDFYGYLHDWEKSVSKGKNQKTA